MSKKTNSSKQSIKSTKSDTSTKKSVSKVKKVPKDVSSEDAVQTLMSLSLFDTPQKKKIPIKGPSRKDLEIDLENDSQESIINKLILNIKSLREELEEYKQYVEGTYCTQAVHDRNYDVLEKKVDDLSYVIENDAMEKD